ncbi:hypothetical protein POV27_06960 [Aureisphaera galaxeae]|uniref:hypothetical protein n=1 Tax=Aureisphaera galaxeae TaxID=1538023 RepID=UPI00235082C3|nr:hypothetical protein [Aureisphaera galaxeae]MDC8003784.1 hypothetical protein [Aureisphaera galaxeae]
MKPLLFTTLIAFLFLGCSSSKLVNEWKSEEAVNFEANKVLVIGLAEDKELRMQFEEQLADQLKKENVIAVRSIDFFESSFADERKSEAELNEIEQQLLEAGFDAILFSKIIGSEDKVTLMQALRNFDNSFNSFREDYYQSQDASQFHNEYQAYTLYHAQTSLYCICPEKERELLWSGNIDIVEGLNRDRSIRDYVKTLVRSLEDRQLLIVNL